MPFRNNLFQGELTVQSHTREDVFLQLPVSAYATTQVDEFELDLLPFLSEQVISAALRAAGQVPDPAFSTFAFSPAQLAAYRRDFYAPRLADYDLSQQAHWLIPPQQLVPLALDVRETKVLLMQYHDRTGHNSFESSFGLITGDQQDAYLVSVCVEYEELIPPTT